MKGIELSRSYFENVFLPRLRDELPEYESRLAAGLAGEGSECFGYDDELSADHSWGIRLCLWLPDDADEKEISRLREFYERLPEKYMGSELLKSSSPMENVRSGVCRVSEFYSAVTGLGALPRSSGDWLRVKEPKLACAVNGEVYMDGFGSFTAYRNSLSEYYPRDVWLRRMAESAALAAQTGQYNLARCSVHGEELACAIVRSRFAESAAALTFLLNRKYRPFYKWSFRALRSLPVLGSEMHDRLLKLMQSGSIRQQVELAEDISSLIIGEMRRLELTDSTSDFLMDHCGELLRRIGDTELMLLPVDLTF